MRTVCLLPARNCAEDLPDYFEPIAGLVDAVVALDDGSTDRTREILEAEPSVHVLLTNPPRDHYRGWDDAGNRNRLLRAAGDLEPDWIFFLDADERVAPDDREAFKELVSGEVEPPQAYLFHWFGLTSDGRAYGPGPWIGRLFTYSPEQVLPAERLHLVPIPTSIPRELWRKTTVRIQHLAGSTEERRINRYRKYQEVDPEHEYQSSYEHLLKPGGPVRPWQPRPPELPALVNGSHAPAAKHKGPLLSAIIISRDDGRLIEPAVASAVAQQCPFSFEIIAAVSGSGGTADFIRHRFPQVRVVELDHPALPGEARNAGLRVARGRYVSFLGSHVVVEPGAFTSRVRAHERGYAMVTGTMLNGTLTPSGWATYFLDNSGVLPGRPSGQLALPPVRCSYLREALLAIGGFPEDMRAGEDTAVNQRLFARGYGAYREPKIVLRHHSRCRTVGLLLKHHFERGRALGRSLFDDPFLKDALREVIEFVVRYPGTRTASVRQDVRRWGPDLTWKFRLVLPLVWVAALSAWAGILYELATTVGKRIRRGPGRSSASAPSRS